MSKSIFSVEKPEESAGLLLWQTTALWQQRIKKALDPYNIYHAQFVILAIILWYESKNTEVSQGLIIHQSKLDKMIVSNGLKKLVVEGYVKRLENEKDMRAKKVYLTKKGKAMAEKLIPIVEKVDEDFFGMIKKTDQNALINILNNLVLNIEKGN